MFTYLKLNKNTSFGHPLRIHLLNSCFNHYRVAKISKKQLKTKKPQYYMFYCLNFTQNIIQQQLIKHLGKARFHWSC